MKKTNHPRTDYLYQFQGKIFKKRLAIAPPTSKYAGQSYYVLHIQQADSTRRSIQVFKSKLANPQIWTTIEAGECFGSPYSFYCRNQKGYYYLVDWEKRPKSKNHDLN